VHEDDGETIKLLILVKLYQVGLDSSQVKGLVNDVLLLVDANYDLFLAFKRLKRANSFVDLDDSLVDRVRSLNDVRMMVLL
jgi:hypothetical protein